MFDEKRAKELAEQLGINVTFNSPTPGIFTVDDKGNKKEVELTDLFPELKTEPK